MNGSMTVAGKTDGFGPQMMAQISGVAFCRRQGRSYVHTPFRKMEHLPENVTPAEMDRFGSIGYMSDCWDNLSDLDKARVEIRPVCEEVARSPDDFLDADCRELLREKHARGTRAEFAGSPAVAGEQAAFVVALHIRRGAATSTAYPSRYTEDARYLALLSALAATHPGALLRIYSEGDEGSLATIVEAARDLAAFQAVELHLNDDVRSTFCALVDADALVVAKCEFSYAAGVLSRGIVYSDLVRTGIWGWHRPLSVWQRLGLVPKVEHGYSTPSKTSEHGNSTPGKMSWSDTDRGIRHSMTNHPMLERSARFSKEHHDGDDDEEETTPEKAPVQIATKPRTKAKSGPLGCVCCMHR